MGLSMLERQSPPVAWGSSEPQPWPSGTALTKRAAAKRCRWTRIFARSWIGAGMRTSRTQQRLCPGIRFAHCCSGAKAGERPAAGGKGKAALEPGSYEPCPPFKAGPDQPPGARAVPLSAPPWLHPSAGSGPCLSAPRLAADAALLHARRVRSRGPDLKRRPPLAASSDHTSARFFILTP